MTAPPSPPLRPDYTPHARAERLIAMGRLVLAVSSLVAIYLEPSTPAMHQRSTYTLLSIYAAYALVVTLIAWRAPVPSGRWRRLSHVADLVLFSVFVYLTEGPASPFFLYFVFSLFCATLRFSWRGILGTGVAAMAIYGVIAVVASSTAPHFEIGRAMIRVAYLGVIAALLVYLGVYQQSLRTELASLAAWPRELAARMKDALRVTLAHASTVVNAERVLLVWEEREEPWVYAAESWRGDSCRIERVPPGTYDAAGVDAVRNMSAFVREAGEAMLLYDPAHSTVVDAVGDPVGNDLRARYKIGSAIVVSFETETVSARFIIPGVRAATADDLALAHVAGRLLLATLEQFFFVQQVRQTASAEERLRISRDLHDGIVQSLAGVGLQLHAMRMRIGDDSELAEQLRHVQHVIEHDQRELRTLVRELRPHDGRDGAAIVTDELQRMRERFPLEWGLELDVESPPPAVPTRLAHDLCRIVNESLSNAARHGGASRAAVAFGVRDGALEIRVSDNGRGFPFAGRRDLAALERAGEGPRTLKERVRNLGGSLLVESSREGAAVEVRIPMQEEPA